MVDLTDATTFILSDIFSLNQLWDESFDRRVYHHLHNNDFSNARHSYYKVLKNALSVKELEKLSQCIGNWFRPRRIFSSHCITSDFKT